MDSSRICTCGHYEEEHVAYKTDIDTLIRKCNCGCRTFRPAIDGGDPIETPEQIGNKTYKVKLGDKLEVNGHIFVISEINMRIFQTPQLKIQSLMEFMEFTTDEK